MAKNGFASPLYSAPGLGLAALCLASLALSTPLHAQSPESAPLRVDELRGDPAPDTLRRYANSNTVTILTGGTRASHVDLTTDLSDILNSVEDGQFSLRVVPLVGEGGRQNALDVLYLRGVDMAVVQTDVLAYLRGESPIFYKNIDRQVRYITQLSREEWHVLAGPSIKSLSDLRGKTINISTPFSSNYITSKSILELLITRAKYTTFTDGVALEKLRAGEIDAVAILAAAPSTLIQGIKKEDNLRLLPVTFYEKSVYDVPFKNTLEHFYLPASLKHEDYPNLIPENQTVASVSAGTVLAVYNWPKGSERHRRVKKFTEAFFKKLADFYKPGRHPKWREVNIAAEVPGWRRFGVAETELARLQRSNKNSTVSFSQAQLVEFEAFKAFLAGEDSSGLSGGMTPDQERELYRRFLEWRQSPSSQ